MGLTSASPADNLDEAAVLSLVDRFGVEPDESCVVSIAAAPLHGQGTRQLVYGSVLFGPSLMVSESWPAWAARTDRFMAQQIANWGVAGVDLTAWREFTAEHADWLFGRWAVSSPDLPLISAWLTRVARRRGRHVSRPTDQVHGAGGDRPGSHLSLSRQLGSAAHDAGSAAHRRIPVPAGAPPEGASPPETWNLAGYPVPSAPLWLLGLPISASPLFSRAHDATSGPEPGLYVGRLERRAWLHAIHVDSAAHDTYVIGVALEEDRVGLADLEIDLEEYLDGNMAAARRLRLGDTALPSTPLAAGSQLARVDVRLRTVGPGAFRQVRLIDRDGLLLDTTDRSPVVEQINIQIKVGGAPAHTVRVGSPVAVGLLERLTLADEVQAAYNKLLEDGLPGRVIDDPATGLPRLRALLREAGGELLVLDPYFGWQLVDWDVLADVTAPIRVLSSHGYYQPKTGLLTQRKFQAPPPGAAPQAPTLACRTWQTPRPAWHDRLYLWDRRGLVVGTSPSGLGRRAARIDRLGAVEVDGWRKLFETWWASPSVGPV
ncbi:MAG: hypothetical protein M3Y35_16640 [Actinomycetota bacterium]|nr:hypothetical protein [Actinomycetota bacterium]